MIAEFFKSFHQLMHNLQSGLSIYIRNYIISCQFESTICYLFVNKLSTCICLYVVDCILRLLDDRYILILGLCERVKDQDKALLERTLPVLQQRLHKTGAALTDCSMVSERIQEWQVLFYQYGRAFSLWGFFLLQYMR